MIIGNGLIANSFIKYKDDNDVLVFASGVSNSKEVRKREFEREKVLLEKSIREHSFKLMVYFSTTSIYDPTLSDQPYIKHKLNLENLIESKCSRYLIIRASNVVGKGENIKTIVNFIVRRVCTDRELEVWEFAQRNLLDVEDLVKITNCLIQRKQYHNKIVNVANSTNMPIVDLVRQTEKFFKKKANYRISKKGGSVNADISLIEPLISELGIEFDADYFSRLLHKYY